MIAKWENFVTDLEAGFAKGLITNNQLKNKLTEAFGSKTAETLYLDIVGKSAVSANG